MEQLFDDLEDFGAFDDAISGDVRDPYTELARLRNEEPVQRLDTSGALPHEESLPMFIVYRHEDIQQMLRDHIAWAQRLASMIDADPDFERVAPVPFSVVNFRLKGTDDQNRSIMDRVNASGKTFISSTVLNGQFVLHIAIGNLATTWQDVEQVWQLIRSSKK